MTADKQSFLDKLNLALIGRGAAEADIAPYIERFDKYYDRMVSDGAEVSGMLNNVDTLADNIASQIEARNAEISNFARQAMMASEPAPEPAPEPEPAPAPEAELTDDREPTVRPAPFAPSKPIADGKADIFAEPQTAPPDIDSQPTAEADIAAIQNAVTAEEYKTEATSEGAPLVTDFPEDGDGADGGDDGEEHPMLPEYVEEPLGDTKKFYILFFSTLPVTAVLLLAGGLLFAGVWAALGILIVASVVLLAGVAACGGAVSLVGIVYGIVRLFDSKAVGLYEIGLGILVAGAAMLSSILLYNLAIRLLPYTIKKVGRLFRFVLRKLRQLFRYVRKEMSKQ